MVKTLTDARLPFVANDELAAFQRHPHICSAALQRIGFGRTFGPFARWIDNGTQSTGITSSYRAGRWGRRIRTP
ncbi:hypothetical protein NS319_15195 [Sphingomonas sanguinis]|uniref:Uncharacterized protein n=1 Tax=Sphingomonas sanguinis TaxID=33051 RepID=A0A147HTH7_9SPHN|nr:hypothetical protein NS319_15195 [Sphingomonas sanguinis]